MDPDDPFADHFAIPPAPPVSQPAEVPRSVAMPEYERGVVVAGEVKARADPMLQWLALIQVDVHLAPKPTRCPRDRVSKA